MHRGLHDGKKTSWVIPDPVGSDFGVRLQKGSAALEPTQMDDNAVRRQTDDVRLTASWRHRVAI